MSIRHELIRGRTEPVQLLYGEESPLLSSILQTYYHLLDEPRATRELRGWGGWYPEWELPSEATRWILGRLPGTTERMVESAWECISRDASRATPAITQLLYLLPHLLGSENFDLYLHFPENALSPRLQKELADVILVSVGARGCRYVIRTHSELMGLRMLRRIREGRDPKTVRAWHIKPDHAVSSLVNSDGEFTDFTHGLWDDFFEELF
jgi:hypothetical protein